MSHRVLSSILAVLMMLPPFPAVAMARNEMESNAPVSTVGSEQIGSMATARTVADVLRTVPGASDGMKDSPRDSIDWGNVPVTLVDGRRTSQPGSLDPNLVDRIEVLKDGAAAIYGSDAIAGVVNVITNSGTGSQDAVSGLVTQREWPGEAYGYGGPLVATGRNGRQSGAAFFTPSGVPYAFVTGDQFRGDAAPALNALQHGCFMTASDPAVRDLGKMFATPGGPPIRIGKGQIQVGGKSTVFDDWDEGPPLRGPKAALPVLQDLGYPRAAAANGVAPVSYPLDYKWSSRAGLTPSLRWTDSGPAAVDRPDDQLPRLNLPPIRYELMDRGGGMTQIDPPTIIPIGDQGSGGGLRQDGTSPTRDDVVTDSDVEHGANKLTPEQQAELERMGLTPRQSGTPPITPPTGASNTPSTATPPTTTPPAGGAATTTGPSESVMDELEAAQRTMPLNPHQPQGTPTTSTTSDGGLMRQYRDGTTEITRPDGSQTVTYPDGSRFQRHADGSMTDTQRDGTRINRDAQGTETGRTAGGQGDRAVIGDPHRAADAPVRDLDATMQRHSTGNKKSAAGKDKDGSKKSTQKKSKPKSDKRFKGAGVGLPADARAQASLCTTVASATDANGNTVTVEKQDDGSVTRTVTNASGQVVESGPLAGADKTRVKPKDQRTFVSTRDERGNVTTVEKHPDGTMTRTVTAPDGTVLEQGQITPPPPTVPARQPGQTSVSATDSNGNTVSITKQADGSSVRTVTAPDGTVLDQSEVTPPPPTKVKPRGPTSASATDANGNTTTISKNPDGSTTRTVTDANGNVLEQGPVTPPPPTKPGPRGPDSASATNPDGSTTTITTNEDGTKTKTVTDAHGNVTETGPLTPPPPTTVRPRTPGTTEASTTDENGTTTTIKKQPDGTTTRTITDADGTVLDSSTVTPPPPSTPAPRVPDSMSGTNPDGSTTTLTRNPDGSLTRTVTDAGGNVTESGPVTPPAPSTPAPRGPTEMSGRNPDGSTTTIRTNPDGTQTRTVTDANGNVTESGPHTQPPPTLPKPKPKEPSSMSGTNPDGTTTTIRTNPDGSQTKTVTDADGNTISEGPHTQPPLTLPSTPRPPADGSWSASGTDANGNTTTVRGNPDGSQTRTVTDRNGNIIEQTVTPPRPPRGQRPPSGPPSVAVTDEHGNTVAIQGQPDGTVVRTMINPNGQVVDRGPLVTPAPSVPGQSQGCKGGPAASQSSALSTGAAPVMNDFRVGNNYGLCGMAQATMYERQHPEVERAEEPVRTRPLGLDSAAWAAYDVRIPWEQHQSGVSGYQFPVQNGLSDLQSWKQFAGTGATAQYLPYFESGIRMGGMVYSNLGTYKEDEHPAAMQPKDFQLGSGLQYGFQDKSLGLSAAYDRGQESSTGQHASSIFTPERIAEIAREDAEITRDYMAGHGQPFTPMAGFDLDRALRGFEPQHVMVMPNGCSAASKAQRLEDIRTMLGGNVAPDDPRVYLIEAIFQRWWQLVPNDPDYRASEAAKKAAAGEKARKEFVKHRRNLTELSAFGSGTTTKDFGPQHGPVKDKALDQWGLQLVGMEQAWDIEDGSEPNVIVAVIDSGLDLAHPDGPQYVWTNPKEQPGNQVDDDGNGYVDDVHGWNFFDENNDLTDTKGHGTLVAGIIAAKRNNGIGIAGINPGARIMPLKVTDHVRPAHSLNIYRAIHYAVRHGARVINISLGDQGLSKLEQLAVNYAHAMGVVVVVASGNQAGDVARHGPAGLRRVVAVGALNMQGEVSAISNRGANLGLIAPGEQIYSLHSKDAEWPGAALDRERYTTPATGTSFSAPIVAGIASLMLAKSPGLPNRLVEDILLDSAGGSAWGPDAGWGLINAPRALQASLDGLMTVRPTEVIVRRDKKRVAAVDVFGIVRGVFADYRVEIGQGREPSEWRPVAGPISEPVEYGLIARIPGEALGKGKDWTVRITATDRRGRTRSATLPLAL